MSKIQVSMKIKNYGEILLELYPEVAPNTVANFLTYVNENLYNGLIFHRVIKGFMIQGGGTHKNLKPIKGEFASNGFKNDLKHEPGVVSMARTMMPNSATSQFFIMHKSAPHLDGNYAAFGKVIEGFEIVDKIANVKTDQFDQPFEDVIIETVEILDKDYQIKEVEYL